MVGKQSRLPHQRDANHNIGDRCENQPYDNYWFERLEFDEILDNGA